eukprot:TRINITY_DN15687_c0_g1_i2.p2 TRINITY_DN15687_c0_g1~~TRINITY_DN15687_c0_g1_i2.p2  ORF type:complete len:203 (-),score=43.70 TRINITY_DN15687_c0_g1_i2:63-671(-)
METAMRAVREGVKAPLADSEDRDAASGDEGSGISWEAGEGEDLAQEAATRQRGQGSNGLEAVEGSEEKGHPMAGIRATAERWRSGLVSGDRAVCAEVYGLDDPTFDRQDLRRLLTAVAALPRQVNAQDANGLTELLEEGMDAEMVDGEPRATLKGPKSHTLSGLDVGSPPMVALLQLLTNLALRQHENHSDTACPDGVDQFA